MKQIKWIGNNFSVPNAQPLITDESVEKTREFHRSLEGYEKTPLNSLSALAAFLNVGEINVKDESKRFGLNAFKVLGATYAMANYIAKKAGISEKITYEQLISKEMQDRIGKVTFYAATDGNHGRAVAWTAEKLGQKAVIYMPKGSSKERLENILATGAEASITDMNYDDAVRFAEEKANETNGIIIQDTAWQGYTEIPTWIMQGYSTIADEVMEDLKEVPTHIFLQAGVGAFAGAIQAYFNYYCGKNHLPQPIVTIVEPDCADCYYRSAKEGKMQFVSGDMFTLMAGLACGEPNPIGFDIIAEKSSFFASCSDAITADGMRILANPMGNDAKIIAGESGAVGIGALAHIMKDKKLSDFKKALNLNENSRVLIISTEGATDVKRYFDVVWYGANEIDDENCI